MQHWWVWQVSHLDPTQPFIGLLKGLPHPHAGSYSNDLFSFDTRTPESGWRKLEAAPDAAPGPRGWFQASKPPTAITIVLLRPPCMLQALLSAAAAAATTAAANSVRGREMRVGTHQHLSLMPELVPKCFCLQPCESLLWCSNKQASAVGGGAIAVHGGNAPDNSRLGDLWLLRHK